MQPQRDSINHFLRLKLMVPSFRRYLLSLFLIWVIIFVAKTQAAICFQWLLNTNFLTQLQRNLTGSQSMWAVLLSKLQDRKFKKWWNFWRWSEKTEISAIFQFSILVFIKLTKMFWPFYKHRRLVIISKRLFEIVGVSVKNILILISTYLFIPDYITIPLFSIIHCWI